MSNSLQPMKPARLLCPWDSPGKNTGVGCHALLHRVFLTQDPGMEPVSLMPPALAGGLFTASPTGEALTSIYNLLNPFCKLLKYFLILVIMYSKE